MKKQILTTAKSLGYLKNNFLFSTYAKSLVVSSALNSEETGFEQIKNVLDVLNLKYTMVDVPCSIFAGVTFKAFRVIKK